MKRTCIECGEQFETTSSRRQICYKDHYRSCRVCGKSFAVTPLQILQDKQTCSEQCRRMSIGTSVASTTPSVLCTCRLCGNKFLGKNKNSVICNRKHIVQCAVCGKDFEPSRQQLLSETLTCSKECRYKLTNQSFMENIQQHVEKQQATMQKRYGVSNPQQVPDIRSKTRSTIMRRYGTSSFSQTPEFIDRCIATNRAKYGADWYMQTSEFRASFEATCVAKYGVDNPSKSPDVISDRVSDPTCIDNLMAFRSNPEQFVRSTFDDPPTLAQLGAICGIRDSSVGDILDKANCRHIVKFAYSTMEDEVYEFLRTFLDDKDIVRNTRKIITPYELDIWIPSHRFAIECNPTSTHNSSLPGFSKDDKPKSMFYHKKKTDLCETQDIRLFHLFGYDWNYHKDVCKSMIRNALGVTTNRYYARKLIFRSVDAKEAYDFLQVNHRQGGVYCKVNLGLFDNDQLVSLMTFSPMRHTIGTDKTDRTNWWELVRFCSLINSVVVGGASKLFHEFLRQVKPAGVVSFSDRAHTSGVLYTKLGFTKLRTSDPGYVWVNLKTDRAYSRLNAQKRNIKKFLKDDLIDLTQPESKIMVAHGYVAVYDSGTITWIYANDKGGTSLE